jgi:hypothetical protein
MVMLLMSGVDGSVRQKYRLSTEASAHCRPLRVREKAEIAVAVDLAQILVLSCRYALLSPIISFMNSPGVSQIHDHSPS